MDYMVDMYNLGLINSAEKRILEQYLLSSSFIQRKDYDEYYVDKRWQTVSCLDIQDLMIIAEAFLVTIETDCVRIAQYPS